MSIGQPRGINSCATCTVRSRYGLSLFMTTIRSRSLSGRASPWAWLPNKITFSGWNFSTIRRVTSWISASSTTVAFSRSTISMTCVIRVPSKDCKCAIHLFREHCARQLVRKCDPAETQRFVRPGSCGLAPSISAADREHHVLYAVILRIAQQARDLFRTAHLPSAVEQHQHGLRPAGELFHLGKQFRLAGRLQYLDLGIGTRALHVIRDEFGGAALLASACARDYPGEVHFHWLDFIRPWHPQRTCSPTSPSFRFSMNSNAKRSPACSNLSNTAKATPSTPTETPARRSTSFAMGSPRCGSRMMRARNSPSPSPATVKSSAR